ncbi:MAG TPA: GDP-mannose 4,6-dehydratase [Anaerolineae bacterium]|nr:GDP-mannose 4,6-dehydratase [Anaerolineae bacterium]
MRSLITGAGGFVGGHLCAYLLAHTDWELTGTVYPHPVDAQPQEPRLRLKHADLRDPEGVQALVGELQPDTIFHLAAQSFVPVSFADPWDTLQNNIRAQLNLLEAVRRSGRDVRVLVVGSNEEYGAPKPEELPQTEESPLRPNNPYAVSKVAQDFLGLQYYLAYGLPVVRVRPFNHTGPGQAPRFVVPAFASQIARIEAGLQEPVMKVGNLEAARDFTDVRDIVRAYHLAASQGEPGEVYNLASGRPQSVRGLLEMLLSYSRTQIRVERDPSRYRPVDVPVVYGSAAKFRQRTGWEPQIPFEQTLRDTLAYWREQAGAMEHD